MVDIKDISGNPRFSTPINEGSKRKFLLMKEDYILLTFSLSEPVYFTKPAPGGSLYNRRRPSGSGGRSGL